MTTTEALLRELNLEEGERVAFHLWSNDSLLREGLVYGATDLVCSETDRVIDVHVTYWDHTRQEERRTTVDSRFVYKLVPCPEVLTPSKAELVEA